MNYILFDDPLIRTSLLPLTFTRPVAQIRIGIFTIAEKWENLLQTSVYFSTSKFLQEKFSPSIPDGESIFINGAVCPTPELVIEILKLQNREAIVKDEIIIAYKDHSAGLKKEYSPSLTILKQLWDIFNFNSYEIQSDFNFIKKERSSHNINDIHTRVYNPENIISRIKCYPLCRRTRR